MLAVNASSQVSRTEEHQVEDLIGKIGHWGRLRVVVNNEGAGSRRSGIEPRDRSGSRWNKMRGANLDSTYFVASYALPVMRDSGGGAIACSVFWRSGAVRDPSRASRR
jgi:NAD(P)-dependent dehydrogenase (short-subunit alcohol dehydrogenase family)